MRYNGVILNVHFPMVVYKKLLMGKPNLNDLKELHPVIHNINININIIYKIILIKFKYNCYIKNNIIIINLYFLFFIYLIKKN